MDVSKGVSTEWYWIERMALVELICEAYGCTPREALKQDPRMVLPMLENRMLRKAKELHNQEGGMKELAKQPYLVALWRDMCKAGGDDGISS